MYVNNVKNAIQSGKTVIGIELGSTRIKAVFIGEDNVPIASGSHDRENCYVNNIWAYSLEDIWKGVQNYCKKMANNLKQQYGVTLQKPAAMGFSGIMHGNITFD